jgi:transcriptional regulator with XRE-family HTH domain
MSMHPRHWRKNVLDMPTRELADRFLVSEVRIRNIENGHNAPDSRLMYLYCEKSGGLVLPTDFPRPYPKHRS